MEKTFTYEEAQTLLPVLESLLRRAVEAKELVQQVEEEFDELKAQIVVSGGILVDIVRMAGRRAAKDKALQAVKDTLGEIVAIGVQVKDLEIGLLDFPCVVAGETVLLCWKMGESGITHWHGTDEGFRGRKPVDDRITNPRKKSRPN